MLDVLLEIEIIKKKVCVRFSYIMIIGLSLFAFYYFYEGIEPMNYLIGILSLLHILLFFIPYKLSYESMRSFIPVYLVFISTILYIESLFFFIFSQITIFLWYSIIPVGTVIFFEKEKVISWSISIFIIACSVFIIVPFIPKDYFYQHPADGQLVVINIMTVIMTTGLILFFVYYQNKINQIKELQLAKYKIKEDKDIKDMGNIKFDNLYTDILTYFSEKKPYCDPDFTILQLAKDLNSNVKYISKVIKIKQNINFNLFLNIYRVNQVKEMIAMNYQNKYTLGYIYFKSGFRNQSTFNKAFKNIEGITPSKYIENKKILR